MVQQILVVLVEKLRLRRGQGARGYCVCLLLFVFVIYVERSSFGTLGVGDFGGGRLGPGRDEGETTVRILLCLCFETKVCFVFVFRDETLCKALGSMWVSVISVGKLVPVWGGATDCSCFILFCFLLQGERARFVLLDFGEFWWRR